MTLAGRPLYAAQCGRCGMVYPAGLPLFIGDCGSPPPARMVKSFGGRLTIR